MDEVQTETESDSPLLVFLDTSCIVRYLTDDPPEMAERAARIIDSEQILTVSELAVVETAYVLESVYGYEREELVDALQSFIELQNIRLLRLPKARVTEALNLCRGSKRYSFTDALLWAEALHHKAAQLLTFDRRFPKVDLNVVEPPSFAEPSSDS